jgi:NAD(P) transhydrogenase subunit alpha
VAATPVTVKQLLGLGYDVVVEKGAGESASFRDEAYAEAGALMVGADEAWGSEVVLRVNPPTEDEISRLADGATLIGMLSPGLRPELVEGLAARPITALALDVVPRISRAQSMDVLSSMANIAGYRAVIGRAKSRPPRSSSRVPVLRGWRRLVLRAAWARSSGRRTRGRRWRIR